MLNNKAAIVSRKIFKWWKRSLIAWYQQGESITALFDELNILCSTLYRWLKSFPTDSDGSPSTFSFRDYALLQRKVEKLQNIITILKSADYLVSTPLKERLYALESFYGKYEVHIICEVLDVDRSTFYNHMLRSKRENAWFEKRRKEYCRLIRDVFDEYHRVLGAEKIRTILTQRRYYVSAAYIARLMREMNSAVFERQRSRNIWKCVSQSARKTFFGSNPVPSGRTKDGLVMSPVSSSETTISIFAWLPTSSLAE